KNSGNGQFSFNAGTIKNLIGDSSIYDALGRTVHYNVNLSDNKYIGYAGFLYKTYKLKRNQLEVILNVNSNYAHNPAYVNSLPILSKILSTYHVLRISYSYRDWLKFGGT